MKHSIRLISAGALLAAGLPMAAMAQVPVTVSVNVQGSCAVSTPTNAAYGAFTPAAASTNLDWTGSVVLRCNKGATPFVAVSYGNNAVGTQRQMKTAGTDLIAYSIQKPSLSGTNFTTCPAFGAGTAWGDAASGTGRLDASAAFSAAGGNSTINLCVQATITDVMGTGLYSDVVQVSVALL
jgi:spore coat protein U-like protein